MGAVLTTYDAAVAALEDYSAAASAALSASAGSVTGASAEVPDSVLVKAGQEANSALAILTENGVARIEARLTNLGL